jgi:O-antigen/teichoic acid export membrane protein
MKPGTSAKEIMQCYLERKERPIPPVTVKPASCKENILLGEDGAAFITNAVRATAAGAIAGPVIATMLVAASLALLAMLHSFASPALVRGSPDSIVVVALADVLFKEPRLVPLLQFMALVVPFLTISNVLLGSARGFGRMDYAAFGENVIQSLVRIVLLSILAIVGMDLFFALVVFGIADVTAAVAMAVLLNRQFPMRPAAHGGVRYPVRDVFGFALPLWVSGLINRFRRNIEVLLLGQDAPLSSALALERRALQILFASADKEEGMEAFVQRRRPSFQGR